MKSWLILGATFTGLAVILGAFGAHGLKTRVSPDDLVIFETGVRYQMCHGLGLILLGLIGFNVPESILHLPAILLTAGIFIFSGSLYLLVLTDMRWLGAITPIGGLFFVIGWALLAINLYRS